MIDEESVKKNIGNGKSEINELAEELFEYLFFLIRNPLL
jgi:hypothetical protein